MESQVGPHGLEIKLLWISPHPMMKSMKIQKIASQPSHWPVRRKLIEHLGSSVQGSRSVEEPKQHFKNIVQGLFAQSSPLMGCRMDQASCGPRNRLRTERKLLQNRHQAMLAISAGQKRGSGMAHQPIRLPTHPPSHVHNLHSAQTCTGFYSFFL